MSINEKEVITLFTEWVRLLELVKKSPTEDLTDKYRDMITPLEDKIRRFLQSNEGLKEKYSPNFSQLSRSSKELLKESFERLVNKKE